MAVLAVNVVWVSLWEQEKQAKVFDAGPRDDTLLR
jgi:hypothetical protein